MKITCSYNGRHFSQGSFSVKRCTWTQRTTAMRLKTGKGSLSMFSNKWMLKSIWPCSWIDWRRPSKAQHRRRRSSITLVASLRTKLFARRVLTNTAVMKHSCPLESLLRIKNLCRKAWKLLLLATFWIKTISTTVKNATKKSMHWKEHV